MLISLNNKPQKTFNGNGKREIIKPTTVEREDMLKVVSYFNASGVYILLFVAFKWARVKETYRDNFSAVKIYNIIQINRPTRCNNLSSLLLDVYLQFNMFRASSRPSLGA
jgi:hypothetical protein